MDKSANTLSKIKKIVYEFDSNAEIILYGSRARGTATVESDWDLLILTEVKADNQLKHQIRRALYDIELELDEIISVIIHEKIYWHRQLNRVTPFYQNVSEEGYSI